MASSVVTVGAGASLDLVDATSLGAMDEGVTQRDGAGRR